MRNVLTFWIVCNNHVVGLVWPFEFISIIDFVYNVSSQHSHGVLHHDR